jgi:hypothetical protein
VVILPHCGEKKLQKKFAKKCEKCGFCVIIKISNNYFPLPAGHSVPFSHKSVHFKK